MRFYNYLTEAEEITYEDIKRDCKPFLNDWKKQMKSFLFSGRQSDDNFIKRKVRKNRKPKDTPEVVHNLVDNLFEKYMNIRPRSNSVFCYNEPRKTYGYGNSYMIFPIGKYKILWSPKVTDLYEYLFQKHNLFINYLKKNPDAPKDEEEKDKLDKIRKDMEDIIKTYKLVDASEIHKADEENELMLLTDSYYGINNKYFNKNRIEVFDNLEI